MIMIQENELNTLVLKKDEEYIGIKPVLEFDLEKIKKAIATNEEAMKAGKKVMEKYSDALKNLMEK